jgi:hypothetical protein
MKWQGFCGWRKILSDEDVKPQRGFRLFLYSNLFLEPGTSGVPEQEESIFGDRFNHHKGDEPTGQC